MQGWLRTRVELKAVSKCMTGQPKTNCSVEEVVDPFESTGCHPRAPVRSLQKRKSQSLRSKGLEKRVGRELVSTRILIDVGMGLERRKSPVV